MKVVKKNPSKNELGVCDQLLYLFGLSNKMLSILSEGAVQARSLPLMVWIALWLNVSLLLLILLCT